MMETIIINAEKSKNKVPIKLVKYIMNNCDSFNNDVLTQDRESNLKEIMYIERPTRGVLDFFKCTRQNGETFFALGHINDGII